MQYDENAEKYGYEGEMTPMKCDELKAYKADVTIPVYGTIADAEVYLKKDVDAAIADLKEFAEDACLERDDNQTAIDELQAENAELKKKLMPCLNGDCILTCEVVEKYGKENAELKQKLDDVQASMYCDVVDANMENRRLRRALWIARAKRAIEKIAWFKLWNASISTMNPEDGARQEFDKWKKNLGKCLEKAEEYK